MAKRKPKPKSPAQIAAEKALQRARDFESVELQPEASFLPSSQDIDVRRSGQQTVAGARRLDAFDALKDGMARGAYDAARRLEADMRARRGELDRGRAPVRGHDSMSGPMDARLAAGDKVDAVLARVGDRDAFLLTELIYPSVERAHWRQLVAYITGEQNPHAQAAVVRSACANLAAAYNRKVAA